MVNQYLRGTNTASYVIKGNVPAVRRRLVGIPMVRVFISMVTEGELRFGVARRAGAAKLARVIEEFLVRVTIQPWDPDAARQYGQLRADLERIGQPMGNLDMMIGAHAVAADLVLVSHDRAFARIKNLKMEDWSV